MHDKEISAEDEQVFLMKQQVWEQTSVLGSGFFRSVLKLHIRKAAKTNLHQSSDLFSDVIMHFSQSSPAVPH